MKDISVLDIVQVNTRSMNAVFVKVIEISKVLDSYDYDLKNLIRYKGEVLNGEHLASVDFTDEDIIEIYSKENKDAK
jgi:hypothetical protein